MHSPCLAGQIGGARTEQGRGGGDVRSGRLREPTSTGRARPRQAGGVPASVVRSSPHHGQSLSRMQPGAHRPFERPLRPEERGGLILKHPPAHSTRPAVHAVERRACRMESLPADALSLVAVSGQGADASRRGISRHGSKYSTGICGPRAKGAKATPSVARTAATIMNRNCT